MLTCDQALERISAQLDNELTDREEALLEEHLQGCAACRALQTDFQALHTALQESAAAWTAEPPAALAQDVMAAVRAAKVTPFQSKRQAWRRRSWACAAAMLALVLLGGGVRLWLNGPLAGGGMSVGSAAAPSALDAASGAAAPQAAAPETEAESRAVLEDTVTLMTSGSSAGPALPPQADNESASQESAAKEGAGAYSVSGGGGSSLLELESAPPETQSYCGVLTLPAGSAVDLSAYPCYLLDGGACYSVPADVFTALTEAWADADVRTEGDDIAPGAATGLVILPTCAP